MSLALIAIFLVARASAQEVPQVDPGGSVLIHGTVAVDSDGAQVTPRSGTVDYWVNLGDGLVPFSAAIENGKFEMKLPTSLESMGIGRTVLDGREAYCDFWTRESLFENKLALHALWLPEVTVRAFEAGGSRELVDLEVRQGLRSTWDGTGNWRAPDDSQLIAEHAGSPLRLVPLRYSSEFVPFSPQLRWFVRAPGYSWNFVDVDHARGGNYRVELPGAGKLTVRMNGLGSTDSAELCVARVGEEGEPKRVTVLAQAKACVEVDELAADTYVIRSTIHRDSGDAHGPCAFVDVGIDKMAQLDLVLGSISTLGSETTSTALAVPVSVELQAPRAWTERQSSLRCRFWPAINGRLSGEPARTECALAPMNQSGQRWSGSVRLEPGSWVFKIAGIPWAQALDVRSSGTSALGVIPAPVDLSVTYHDASSGATIDGVALYADWSATAEEHLFGCSSAQSAPGLDSQHLRVPAGAVVVHARKHGYASKTIVINAASGMEPVAVSLEPSCGIRLRIESSWAPVFVPFSVSMNVHEIDGDGRLVARSSNQLVQELEVSHAGRYEILPGPILDYPAAAPLCVDVVRGQFTEARLELRR